MTDDVVPIDSAEFRRVLGHFPTGVTVVATVHEGRATGLAVGSFFSVSLDPPLVGFCVGKNSASWKVIQGAGRFVVNVLSDAQVPISNQFAGKGEDKFEGVDWSPSVSNGGPRLDGCIAHIECTLHQVVDAGDHDLVIGAVEALDVQRGDDGPLVFFKGGYHSVQPLD